MACVLPEQVTNMRDSAVPNLANVLMPETFLKKRKSDAKVREEKQSKAAELRKVCVNIFSGSGNVGNV